MILTGASRVACEVFWQLSLSLGLAFVFNYFEYNPQPIDPPTEPRLAL